MMIYELCFDGGNHASLEKEAYGSFRLLSVSDIASIGIIQRLSFGRGYTNNEAEYMTLIGALEYIVKEYNAADIILHIVGDSELVRNQVGIRTKIKVSETDREVAFEDQWQSIWNVKKAHLLPLRYKARELLQQFKAFTYEHVPRKEIVKVLGH